MQKFLNVKVGVEFYDALMSRPSFQGNWKAVSPAFYLVNRIAELNASMNGEAVEFYSGTIADIFQPYTGGGYGRFVEDLEPDILQIDRNCDYAGKPGSSLKAGEAGSCYKYKVTDYGCRLVHSANVAYLKALKGNPVVRRQNQKSISKRKVMFETYGDAVLDYVHDGLKHLSFDLDAAERAFAKSTWSDSQKAHVSRMLRSIETKKFEQLEFKASDGRIHHEEVRLKSDARFLLFYKGMPYRAALDIRCCHPTFFSCYLLSLPLSLHYLTDKGDKSVLAREHEDWVRLFCDPDIDPKEVVRLECGFPDIETAKMALNQSLNGSKRFPKYLAWLKKRFPTLFEIWQMTDIKDTGNAIARTYEHGLILEQGLHDRASTLEMKVLPEHDGIGVFAKDVGTDLESKLDSLASYIQSVSVRRFGVRVVIKTKLAFDWTSADLLLEMQHKRGELDKEYSKLKPVVNRLQKKFFASGCDHDRKAYEDARKREHQLLLRYRDVIDYWQQRDNR